MQPGNVLGDLVGQKHMQRTAGRIRHALADPAVFGRHEIGSADAGVIGAQERKGEIFQPRRRRIGVVVDIDDELAARGRETFVARFAETLVFREMSRTS